MLLECYLNSKNLYLLSFNKLSYILLGKKGETFRIMMRYWFTDEKSILNSEIICEFPEESLILVKIKNYTSSSAESVSTLRIAARELARQSNWPSSCNRERNLCVADSVEEIVEHAPDISAPGGSAKVTGWFYPLQWFAHVFVFNEATCAVNRSIAD